MYTIYINIWQEYTRRPPRDPGFLTLDAKGKPMDEWRYFRGQG